MTEALKNIHRHMKRRNFYPAQVLRTLDGCNPLTLEPGESFALSYFLRKGRRLGVAIAIINASADLSSIATATPAEQRAVMDNTNLRILMRAPAQA
jgi:hypothetical protein